jgi:hypothetical protein
MSGKTYVRLSLLLVSLLVTPQSFAQRPSDPHSLVKVSCDSITAVLDTLTGRFAVQREDGKTLLFVNEYTATSHISVRIGATIYTNYRWAVFNIRPDVITLGKGTPCILADRLQYSWDIHTRDGAYRILEELLPRRSGSRHEVRISVTVANLTAKAAELGAAMVLDVNVAGNDNPALLAGSELCPFETPKTGTAVPETWSAPEARFTAGVVTGWLRGKDISTPDMFLPGRYESHGRLGTAVYGYEGTDQEIWDVAVFMQWNARAVQAGNSITASTSLGWDAPEGIVGRPTFGKEFVVRQELGFILFADSITTVRVSTLLDGPWEAAADRDGHWDTTLTVLPSRPTFARFCWDSSGRGMRKLISDSVGYYRAWTFRLQSDRSFGILTNGATYGNDLETCLPITDADTVFRFPGFFGSGAAYITTLENDTRVSITPTMRGWDVPGFGSWVNQNAGYVKLEKGIFWAASYPPYSSFAVMKSGLPNYPLSEDGAGTLIKANHPILIGQIRCIHAVYGAIPPAKPQIGAYFMGDFAIPACRSGREFVLVPHRKHPSAKRSIDTVRVIVYSDSTTISFRLRPGRRTLHAGEAYDFSFDAPDIMYADKPVALHQIGPHWTTIGSDTVDAGGMCGMIAPEQWGRKYFAVSNFVNVPGWYPNDGQGDFWFYIDNGVPPCMPYYAYLNIVTRWSNRGGVLLNKTPVDAALFQRIGDYAWATIARPPGYDIVESAQPLLVMAYGHDGHCQLPPDPFFAHDSQGGYSYIPPFK